MHRMLLFAVGALIALVFATTALAQSGHFVGTPTCRDVGTTIECTGKVAGLGGTTFEITVEAEGALALVECTNPGGNVAPGQSFSFDPTGTTGDLQTPRNGSFRFNNLETAAPTAPANACPNPQWQAEVTDVVFSGNATLTLTEDGNVSDTIEVPIAA